MKKLHTFLISCILFATVSADILQNPDFELPPSNRNAAPFFLLNATSALPGWSFEGEVQYVTAGDDLPLPEKNGHAILLGEDGKINQTFAAGGEEKQYLLSFTLGRVVRNCTANASVVVSAPDSSGQFSLTLKYGTEPWEVYGQQMGSWGGGEPVNLVIESEDVDADSNSTCWPVIDGLSLITVGSLKQGNDNLLPNGGFESGPAFPESSSSDGVLLDAEPSLIESALQQWTVMGTIKYITSTNHFVPEGKAAVELVSGASSGVQTAKQLVQGSNYNLEFMLGDANDSCSGDFTVGVTAGSVVQNFTLHSNGTGSAKKYSVPFKGDGSSPSSISFQSYTTRQREDGVFCGPVIDGVVLRSSGWQRSSVNCAFVIALLLGVLMKLSELV